MTKWVGSRRRRERGSERKEKKESGTGSEPVKTSLE
jgi:hypothetical protein